MLLCGHSHRWVKGGGDLIYRAGEIWFTGFILQSGGDLILQSRGNDFTERGRICLGQGRGRSDLQSRGQEPPAHRYAQSNHRPTEGAR